MKDDTYQNFRLLTDQESEGTDYCIRTRRAGATLILAPHAGGIEPGTSELAEAIAGDECSFYLFEGIKAQGNNVLHITSANFDEPTCLAMLGLAERVLTIHGEDSDASVTFVGGLDTAGAARITKALASSGFAAEASDKPHLQGLAATNVCNRGRAGAGVQLELSKGLRRTFFRGLSPRSERHHITPVFTRFVAAVRSGLV